MVNRSGARTPRRLGAVSVLITGYVAVMIGTLVALALMASVAPAQATEEAWGHGLVVAVFAVILPVRLRSARAGDARAVRALAIVAAVLLVVNLVEASLPGAFPEWMRIEMAVIALSMAAMLVLLRRSARR